MEETCSLNKYYLVCGIVVGAGGVLAGLQISSLVRKRKKKRLRKIAMKAKSQPAVYQTRVPEALLETIRNHPNLPNDHIVTGRQFSNSSFEELPEENISNNFMTNSPHRQSEVRKDGDILLGLVYSVVESQSKHDNILHRGISCNICTSNPLTGVRYKCVNCVDYDVCAKCEPNCDHDITHVLIKISIPIPPLANPRTTLLSVLYPGKKVLPKTLPWAEVIRLREKSHFDAPYIQVLYEQYKSLCTSKRGISKDTFQSCLGPLTSSKNLVVEQLFKFYDADKDDYINFDDFVNGMSILGRGSKKERMKYIFRGYDLDNDGYIVAEDFQQMFQAYHQLSMELVRDVVRSCEEEMMATYDDNGSRPISAVFNAPIPDSSNSNTTSLWNKKLRSNSASTSSIVDERNKEPAAAVLRSSPLRNRVSIRLENRLPAIEAMTQDAITELVEQIMHNADLNKDKKLSEKEFYDYALIDTSLLAWFEAIDTIF